MHPTRVDVLCVPIPHATATHHIAGNIARASEGVTDANQRIGQTAAVSQNVAEEIGEVSVTARERVAASEQVQASALELSRMAEQLRRMVENYKV
jgi:methyl-accepting chemotaxis protein